MADEFGSGLSESDSGATATAEPSWESQPIGDSGPVAADENVDPGQDTNAAGDNQGADAGIPAPEAGADKPAQPVAQPGSEGAIADSDRAWAKGMGLTDEAIAAFPNATALRAALGGIGSQVIAAAQAAANPPPPQPQPGQGADAQPQPPASLRLDLSQNPAWAEFNEDSQKLLSSISDHTVNVMAQVVQAVNQEVMALRGQIGRMTEDRYASKLRESLGRLDGEWKPIAGKYADGQAMGDVLKHMNAVAESYLRAKQPVPTWDSLLQTVLYSRHAKELAEAQQTARREALKKNDSMLANHAAGPGSGRRVNVAKGGTDEAVARVTEILNR